MNEKPTRPNPNDAAGDDDADAGGRGASPQRRGEVPQRPTPPSTQGRPTRANLPTRGPATPSGASPSAGRTAPPRSSPVPPSQEATRAPGELPEADTGGAAEDVDATVGLERTASFSGESSGQGSGSGSGGAGAREGSSGESRPAPAPKEGQLIARRFVVRRLLGQGGMGRVFAVQDKQIEGRDVALKVLLPKYSRNAHFRKLFFQEVRAAQEFVSEYICQVRDTGETEDGSLFLTMDLVEGEALRSLLDREKLLGQRHALEIARQVLLGLQSGHEKGYVHRDIKPSNVMLSAGVPKTDTNPYGVGVRLLDFGIAGLASEIDERSRAGTVMYMSPEQAGGERLDPRSDLFAVGVLLFEMLSGHRPFEGSTTRALVQSVLETNLTARLGEIPGLSKSTRKLLERALQKDRNRRFQSAGDFAEAIVASAAYRLPQNVPTWIYGALGAAVCVAGAEGFFLMSRAGEESTLRDQLRAADTEKLSAVDTARQEKDAVIREKEALIAEHLKTIAQRETELRESGGELERVRQQLAAASSGAGDIGSQLAAALEDAKNKQTQINDLQDQLRGVRDEKTNLATRVSNLEIEFEKAKAETRRLESERDEARLSGSPKGQLAAAFDRIATLVDGGYGAFAVNALTQFENQAVFAKDDGQLHQFLSALASATARVESHMKSVAGGGAPKLSEIRAAEGELATARELLTALESNRGEWITVAVGTAEPPPRMDQAKKLVEQLSTKVRAQLSASVDEDVASWKSLPLDKVASDPAKFFEHFDRYGCREHATTAAQRLIDALRANVQKSGKLDAAALASTQGLADWVRLLDARQVELDAAAATDLRLFEFARRWYDEDGANDAFDWSKCALAPAAGKSSDWRQVLRLQFALAQPNSGYPIRPRGLVLLRQVDEFGAVSWIEHEDRSKSEDGRTWTIRRRTADADGNFSAETSTLGLERSEGAIRAQDGNAVFLEFKSRSAELSVEPLPPAFAGQVPHALLAPQKLESFRKAYASGGDGSCLVVRDERGFTRWFSPRYGLVREEIAGGWTRDLVYWAGTP